MSHQRSFLVACPGAYAGGGRGTGGLAVVRRGEAHVVDRLDSTAIVASGDRVYRFVRALGALVAYDQSGLREMVRWREARDVHDVLIEGEEIVCVSTSTNEILWYDRHGELLRRWKAQGEGDAWHLNCMTRHEGRLYVAAFGEFAEHRGWNDEGCSGLGFVQDVESGERILEGLSGPHDPLWVDGTLYVCDSFSKTLVMVGPDGPSVAADLGGFTRGLQADEAYLYVGTSSHRKGGEEAQVSQVNVLRRDTLELVDRIDVPFCEIYEFVPISDEFAQTVVENIDEFALGADGPAIVRLHEQVDLGLREIARLREELNAFQRSPGRNVRHALRLLRSRLPGGESKD